MPICHCICIFLPLDLDVLIKLEVNINQNVAQNKFDMILYTGISIFDDLTVCMYLISIDLIYLCLCCLYPKGEISVLPDV